MSRADDIIKRGDAGEILRMGVGAWLAATEGRYCECDAPALIGLDLMCGHCLLENRSQIEKRERVMLAPHAFVENMRGRERDAPYRDRAQYRLGMCQVCSGWRDDPRHDHEAQT